MAHPSHAVRRPILVAVGVLTLALSGCADETITPTQTERLDRSAQLRDLPGVITLTPGAVLATLNGVTVNNGGYGSAIATDPKAAGHFYLMTDRGPNYDYLGGKAFPIPGFTPQIGRFVLEGNAMRLVSTVLLRRADGTPLSGLPNLPGAGGTGEIPYTVSGQTLPFDAEGVDSEGLAVAKDGTFWVSDEYGPHLVHFGTDGRTIERVNAFGPGRTIPSVFAKRRPNRGMEGLAIQPDGKVLVGIMQSPLDNPGRTVRSSRVTRILRFDTRTGESREHVYLLERGGLLNSEIVALTENSFLVLERDGAFPGGAPTFKRIYRIDVGDATDVSDPANGVNGLTFGGRTLEQLTVEELTALGVVPVTKTLVADLTALNYPHDKPEGIAVIDNFTIAVSNDDDFGVTDGAGGLVAKVLPQLGVTDFNTVYFVRVAQPLRRD